jgi:hypothetical protein
MNTENKVETGYNCLSLEIVGFYMFFLLVSSIVFNLLSIWKFYKAKLITPINIFIVSLLGFNLIASFIEAPYMIFNAYNCRFAYSS